MTGICYEALIRTFFTIVKIMLDNWFYVILLAIVVFIIRKSTIMQSFLFTAIDLVQDSFVGGFFGPGMLLAVLGKVLLGTVLAVLLAVLWGITLLSSNANIILKILALPLFMITGMLLGVLPFISLPVNFIMPMLLKKRMIANIVCITMIALTLLFVLTLGSSSVCGYLNNILV